jgi:hypothetical protein
MRIAIAPYRKDHAQFKVGKTEKRRSQRSARAHVRLHGPVSINTIEVICQERRQDLMNDWSGREGAARMRRNPTVTNDGGQASLSS